MIPYYLNNNNNNNNKIENAIFINYIIVIVAFDNEIKLL